MVAFIVYVERSERRIPVQYAKRVVGRKIMGGQIHPPAPARQQRRRHAGDLRQFRADPAADQAGYLFKDNRYFGPVLEALRWGEPLYTLLYAVGIIFFAYFYVSIVFNPKEVADNMRKYGGFIPGIRPGAAHGGPHQRDSDPHHPGRRAVSDHHQLHSGMDDHRHPPQPPAFLAGRRIFERLPSWVTNGLGVNFYFGGTSLLIVVGVAMDTVQQVEAQLIMRHYEGFTPRSGRIRGRRATW